MYVCVCVCTHIIHYNYTFKFGANIKNCSSGLCGEDTSMFLCL